MCASELWRVLRARAITRRGVIHIVGNGPGLELFLKQGEGADPLPEGARGPPCHQDLQKIRRVPPAPQARVG